MSWEFELLDLTRPLTHETGYALLGDIATEEAMVQVTYDRDWTNSNGTLCHLTMPDHVGTHIDAPVHCWKPGAGLEGVDLNRLMGEAVVLDLRRGDVDYGYTAEDLAGSGTEILPGDIVLIHSGYVDARPDERIRQTYLTPEAAQWLVDRGVHAVGCEPAGIEHVPDAFQKLRWYDLDTPNLPSWPAHQVLLSHDVYIIEGLVNLDQVVGERVRFCALPLNIPGVSGCPVRAVCWKDR